MERHTLTDNELTWLLTSPMAMRALVDYHDMQQLDGESQGIDCSGNERKRNFYKAEAERIEKAWEREEEPEQCVFAPLSAPVVAGDPVAWMHAIIEPGREGEPEFMVSRQPENPWRHWLESHRDKCQYSCTPLYASPALAQQAVTGDDVYTLIGHAEVLRSRGETDMSAYIFDLAKRIALTIGDRHLADRCDALAQPQAAQGDAQESAN